MKSTRVVAAVIVVLTLFVPVAHAATTPVILSLSPSSALAGTPGFILTVNGANFAAGAQARWNGSIRQTQLIDSSKVQVVILTGDLVSAITANITVTNPGAPASSAVQFRVLPNEPQLTSLSPGTVAINSGSTVVQVIGQNFGSQSIVRVNNSSRPTDFINDKQLNATLPDTDFRFATTLNITVMNPNSRLSNTLPLTVSSTGGTPSITALDPPTVKSNTGGFFLIIIGSNFVQNSVVRVNGAVRSPFFIDAQHIRVQILGADIAQAGNVGITVTNPNGQASQTANLVVTSATAPILQSINPQTVTAGSPNFTLAITGQNFTAGATVKIGNATRSATFVDAQRLNFTVLTNDILTAGSVPITVITPGVNGGTSNSLQLFVVSKDAPVVTSLSPSSLIVGATQLKILINGQKFLIDDIALADGSPRQTEFVSSTQLAITLLPSDISSPKVVKISVARKNGTDASSPADLTVTAAQAPAITALNPTSGNVGAQPFTLVVAGRNFDANAVVSIDNDPRSTTFISSTELRVGITAADLASPRQLSIVVLNPGGSMSPAVLLPIVLPVPTIATLNPASVTSGDSGVTVTVTGSNFSTRSVVNVNGVPKATTFVTATGALQAAVSAAEIAAPGTLTITVTDGTLVSAPAQLQVRRPTITSVTPNVLPFGAVSERITVQGENFLTTSVIVFNGFALPTEFNADGSLSATLTGTMLNNPGTFFVLVRNSPESTSLGVLVAVASAGAPAITSVEPTTLLVNAESRELIVRGENFVERSTLQIEGSTRTPSFASATEIRYTLTADDVATQRVLHIRVGNPDGAVSNEVTVTVGSGTPPARRRPASPR
ncbi:MAG TPA: IPT/TIG domain-containing protein [Thermoanaerobaculia bacterium]|nr:IPT/TIG domain-containing protein [Thermoanaerobaculia bacterium]